MNLIKLKNWYQFSIKNTDPKVEIPKMIKVIAEAKLQKIISKWFFIFDDQYIVIYFHSTSKLDSVNTKILPLLKSRKLNLRNKKIKQATFIESFFENKKVLNAYINIMVEISQLALLQLDQDFNYDIFDILSYFQHSMFNNFYGTPTEDYFLLKRLAKINIQIGKGFDDPNQTLYSPTQFVVKGKDIHVNVPQMLIPVKSAPVLADKKN